MAASARRSSSVSGVGLGVWGELRRGRLMLVLAWFAFSFGTVAHADCAVHIDPVHSGGPIDPVAASDHSPAIQHPEPEGDHAECQQLLDASTAPPPACLLPSPRGKFAAPPPPLASKPLLETRWQAIVPNWHPPPPAQRVLYLFTSRLLI